MRKRKYFLGILMSTALFSGLFLIKVGLFAQELHLAKAWETDTVFLTPEAVVCDMQMQQLYVSNYNRYPRGGEARDFISRIGLDGKVLDRRWIEGLKAPTGLFLHENHLYVVERDGIGIFNTEDGSRKQKWKIENPGFLNDVVVTEDGSVLYTDTSPRNPEASYVGRISEGKADTLVSAGIVRANGLGLEGNTLLIGSSGNNSLQSFDLEKGQMQTVVLPDTGIIDGIRWLDDAKLLVSHWEGRLYLVGPDSSCILLKDLGDEGLNIADFEYVQEESLLVIPTFRGKKVIAYKILTEDSAQ